MNRQFLYKYIKSKYLLLYVKEITIETEKNIL